MKTMKVKPVEGRAVPIPEKGAALLTEAETVPRTPYWVRRVKDGDVVEEAAKGKGAKQ